MHYFAKNLKLLRTYEDMSQRQIAELLNLDRTTITKYESGSCEPNIETLAKICRIFGVTADDMLFAEGIEDFERITFLE